MSIGTPPSTPIAVLPVAGQLKRVEVFEVHIETQSKKMFVLICPADMTDADCFDVIMEIARNLPETARKNSASRLTVPGGPMAPRS
jgi:hypothetical protein